MMMIRLAFFCIAGLLCTAGCDRKIAGGRVDGAAIYSEVCARCHGPGGVPEPTMVARIGVRPLTSERVRTELTDSDLKKQIWEGSKDRQMPAFAGALSEAQVDAVIAYVRNFK